MTVTINQEKSGFQPTTRLLEELNILEKLAKNIIAGSKTIGNMKYTAILVKGMPLSSKKFTVSNSDVLFLLPLDYPRLPPIGCYLNYPWNTTGEGDHHFTRQ
ncbi:MAG: hypothetical protein ACYTXH_36085, partial [Nostoc sp.]